MIGYIFSRISSGIFVLLGVVILVFFLFQLRRLNPAYALAGESATKETIQNINRELGLDQPVMVQLFVTLNNLSPVSIHSTADIYNVFYLSTEKYKYFTIFQINRTAIIIKQPYFGRSFFTNRRVGELLLEKIPNTLILALAAIILATSVGITLGVFAAVAPNSITDRLLSVGSVLGISLPSFFAAILLQLIFAYLLASVTGLNMTGDIVSPDPYTGVDKYQWKNLLLPAIALGVRPVAVIMQITRSSMLDVLNTDFVRTARAKGAAEKTVLFKHALRNVLIPVLTSITGWFASLLTGAFFIEVIFNYNGIGLETINAIKTKDIPVAMGAVIFTAAIFVIVNIVTDILYSIADPRVTINSTSK